MSSQEQGEENTLFASIIERYGRRRAFLMLVGGVWLLMGWSIVLAPDPIPVSGLPHTYLPEWLRFTLWVASGSVAILASVWQTDHGRSEAVGFAVLYIMPAERTLSYLISWVAALDFVPGVGLERGWIAALQYLAYVGIIYICAGWTEHRRGEN